MKTIIHKIRRLFDADVDEKMIRRLLKERDHSRASGDKLEVAVKTYLQKSDKKKLQEAYERYLEEENPNVF